MRTLFRCGDWLLLKGEKITEKKYFLKCLLFFCGNVFLPMKSSALSFFIRSQNPLCLNLHSLVSVQNTVFWLSIEIKIKTLQKSKFPFVFYFSTDYPLSAADSDYIKGALEDCLFSRWILHNKSWVVFQM